MTYVGIMGRSVQSAARGVLGRCDPANDIELVPRMHLFASCLQLQVAVCIARVAASWASDLSSPRSAPVVCLGPMIVIEHMRYRFPFFRSYLSVAMIANRLTYGH
jgi:hypothetical protein